MKKCKTPIKSFFVPNVNYNMNALNFVEVKYGKNELNFLIDTGASISCIFSEYLQKGEYIDTSGKINIKGIAGSTSSMGSANISLIISNKNFPHHFSVLKSFDLSIHGILGSDFLNKYKAIIDYEKFLITLHNDNDEISVPLKSKVEYCTIIPPRCEIIHYCYTDETEDCVILNEQISDGVIIASTIAKPKANKIPVRILNVNEREIKIKNFQPKLEILSNFEVLNYGRNYISVERVDEVLDSVNMKSLNEEEKTSIQKICAKYADVFHLEGDPLTVTNLYRQKILLKPEAQPVYVKPYRLPHSQKSEIHKQVDKMLQDGIIEEAKSEWSSPLLIVPKKPDKNGVKKFRVVLDYRLLNKQIKDDKFPLPNITEILDSLSGAMYFSHLDLAQGYYQLELHPDSRPYTAFTTERGQYQMKRLGMGLKTSPSAFSRLMTIAMSGLNYDSCFIYLDDLIVFGHSLQNHNQNLLKVLHRLRKVNLKLNPIKCEFLKKEILYLGHIISDKGISPDPEKISAISKYPVPKNSDEAKRFVALTNYYRKFIRNFAAIAQPLNDLSRKGKVFQWNEDCEKAFQTLRTVLQKAPILQYPDFSESNEFILRTDASGFALGSVLSNSNDHPIAYASRSLNSAEKNYCTIEKELLAIIWSVKHFRPYLFGRKFKILTDHRPLIYLFNMTNPSSRLTKFRLILEEYDFSVHYVKGSENVTADALSRIKLESEDLKEIQNRSIEKLNVITRSHSKKEKPSEQSQTNISLERTDHPVVVEVLKRPVESVELRPLSNEEFSKLKINQHKIQYNNLVYDVNSHIIYLNQNIRSTHDLGISLRNLEELCTRNNIKELCLLKSSHNIQFLNVLMKYKNQILGKSLTINIVRNVKRIESREMRQIILNDYHMLPTGGHAGINRMYNNIKREYFWNGLKEDVQNFVKKCDDCQRYKYSLPRKEPMTITSTASSAFQKIFLDLVGPLPIDINENKYILTIQCDLTKFIEGYPLLNKEAETVAKAFIENFVLRYGIPSEVVTDQGTEFLAKVFRESCELLHISHLNSTAHHHETLGMIENSHKHLGAYLRMRANEESNNWSNWVHFWCFSYNNTVNSSTLYTPYELVFGKPSRIPQNIENQIDPIYNFDNYPIELKYRLQKAWKDARENLVKVKIKRKQTFDRNCKKVDYKIGDKVLLENKNIENKLDALFSGPYEIIDVKNSNVVLKKDNKVKEVHKNMIKPYFF